MERTKKEKIGMMIFVIGIGILLATWLMAVTFVLEIFEGTYFFAYLPLLVFLFLVIGIAILAVGIAMADHTLYELPIRRRYFLQTLPSIVWGSMGGIWYFATNEPLLLGMSIVFMFLFTMMTISPFMKKSEKDIEKDIEVLPSPPKQRAGKKVKFLVGIWLIVVALEIILPINYWVENFGWGFFNNENSLIMIPWHGLYLLTIAGGGIYFDMRWKFFGKD